MYQRSLGACEPAPDLTPLLPIDSSVLGLALQGSQGVAAAYDLGMFYTTDGGNTWTQSRNNVATPAAVVRSGGIIYVGTENDGLYFSENGGVNLEETQAGNPQRSMC